MLTVNYVAERGDGQAERPWEAQCFELKAAVTTPLLLHTWFAARFLIYYVTL